MPLEEAPGLRWDVPLCSSCSDSIFVLFKSGGELNLSILPNLSTGVACAEVL